MRTVPCGVAVVSRVVRWGALVVATLLAGCGSAAPDPSSADPVESVDSTEPEPGSTESASGVSEPATTITPSTAVQIPPETGLVVERRAPTEAELDRLDDDGENDVLDCGRDDAGAGVWDYAEIGPDDPTGRVSDDALLDAIADTSGLLPETGWTELIVQPGASTFVHSIVDDDWRAIVIVGGDVELGVWRHHEFYACAARPEPEPDSATFTLDPANPGPGQLFAATFSPGNERGGYFFLSRWTGRSWAEPGYLLESDANSDGRPFVESDPTRFGMNDYGVSGPGPDGLVMPDDLDRGIWRLCTANAADDVCVQILVGVEPPG